MAVGKEKIVLIATFFDQLIAATSNTGAGIDDDDIVAFGPDFKAGGIPPVLDILFPGDRYGASSAPASNNHRSPSGLSCNSNPRFAEEGWHFLAIRPGQAGVIIRRWRHEKYTKCRFAPTY